MIRVKSGGFAPARCVCSAPPDAAPQSTLLGVDGSTLESGVKLPPKGDPASRVFGRSLYVEAGDVGPHALLTEWTEGGQPRASLQVVDVLTVGGTSPYRSMAYYAPPHARFVVGEMEDDSDTFRRNPRT